MKKTFISFCLVVFGLSSTQAFGQEKNIPSAVTDHFQSKYPNAQVHDWDHERDGSYEVEFIYNGQEWEAYYASDGTWLRTERDVRKADVPRPVMDGVKRSSYSDWKMDDVEEHQTPQYASVYEVELKKNGQKTYIYVLPDGQIVK